MQALRLNIEAGGRAADQNRKRRERLTLLLKKRRDGRLLTRQGRLLLHKIRGRRSTIVDARLNELEQLLRGIEIRLRVLDAVAQRENLDIGRRCARGGRKIDGDLIEARRRKRGNGGAAVRRGSDPTHRAHS